MRPDSPYHARHNHGQDGSEKFRHSSALLSLGDKGRQQYFHFGEIIA
jgi:hypothetical protein